MGTVIHPPKPRPRLVVDNGQAPSTVPAISFAGPSGRSRFPLGVTAAGIVGAGLGWWHGWQTVGVIVPIAGALWFAGITAVALGQSEVLDVDAKAVRRQRRP